MEKVGNRGKTTIGALVEENYVFAAVLHYFGISFYQYEQNSLNEVCAKHKVNPIQLIQELDSWARKEEPTSEDLYLHPIEILVEYLKNKHFYFVRQELPFISNMINGIDLGSEYRELLNDLKIMFPLFVDDFIHHIHEEENTLFKRIYLLQEAEKERLHTTETIKLLGNSPIDAMSQSHEDHDDEMEGIRKLTKNYYLKREAPISIRVLYDELQKFEKELITHAYIENQLLFPKAKELEREVKRKIQRKIKWN
ncbi:hemerythrin domain-containing protein [Pararhodonellum marinum]|uniref:hemerythrin domain-containing protein n=1 Tax=Pararhodonellum marinum TaxID=2755358 RepID=UPI0018905C2C|nr:hemerythrin domain-containing protein [Pararhodonellum marinum]